MKHIPKDFKISDMEKVFGFPYTYNPNTAHGTYLNYNTKEQNEPVNIAGYDYLLDLRYSEGKLSRDSLKMFYDHDNEEVRILLHENEIYKMNLSDFGNKIYIKYSNINAVDQQDMIFEDENQYVKVKFIFFYMNGVKYINKDTIKINSADFYTLIKLK